VTATVLAQSKKCRDGFPLKSVMRYLIDGYNLLHALGLLHGRTGPHALENARRALLDRLSNAEDADTDAMTVVFDAAGAPPGAVGEEDYRGIHIYYARDGSADDAIEALIQDEATPSQLTIVSDDHRIQQAGRRRRCPVLGCLDYLEQRQRLHQDKPAAPEASVKPEEVSSDEVQHWLREFADLADDPKWREALGPDFRDEKAS
jgi:predicted RNA-binding protein with PIN domain